MSEEKKIIIDEDWKSSVEAEKEALSQEKDQQGTEEAGAAGEMPQMPPASLEMLLTSLATEAMMSMGQIPKFGTDQLEVNLDQARYAIDMIELLKEKTKGNLSSEEDNGITTLLHQLRMAFIAAQGAGPAEG